MEPVTTRRDFDMPLGVGVAVALILGAAAYVGATEILITLLTFTGAFGLLFGFALLNRWLSRLGIGGYPRVAVNGAALLGVLIGVAASGLFFAVAGNIAGAGACLAAAAGRDPD